MKKLLLCGVVAAGCCLTSAAQSKINNVGRLQLAEFIEQRAELAKTSPARAAAYAPEATVIVTLAQGATADDLETAGFEVLDATADMAIVRIALTEADTLAALDCVKYVDFGTQAAPMMDMARAASSADAVHAGAEGLTQSYKGEDVYVGLYDTGLDPNHINFTDTDGKSRVSAVYLVRNGSTSAYETADEIASFTSDATGESHGTHVLGIAAGRDNVPGKYGIKEGNSNTVKEGNIPYYGVAPAASLLVGCGSFDTNSIQVGVGKVVDRAKRDNKPAVVNLSLGHNRGAHDPRESANKFLDNKAQDAIIVVAAGNEGGSNMSVEKTLRSSTGSSGTLKTFIVPSAGSMAQTYYSAEFWGEDATPMGCTLVLYNTATKAIAAQLVLSGTEGSKTWKGSDNATFASAFTPSSSVSVSWGVDNATGRYNIYMQNNLQSTGTQPIVFGVNITGKSGKTIRVNGYVDAFDGYSQSEAVFSNQGISGYTTGTDKGSINGMACGYNTISVGAWVSRTSMPTLAKNAQNYTGAGEVGRIANFSSYGKSGDGRQLPIVCAPGAQIISSVSKYWVESKSMSENTLNAVSTANGRSNPWYYMQGTSMACPFVTGTIALWLEACPTLRASHIREILAATSVKDSNIDSSNEDRWGYGKINVLAGLKKAIDMNVSIKSTFADNADKNLIITGSGDKQFEICVVGVNDLSAALYNLQGAQVAVAEGNGDTLNLDASALAEGIYVVSVNAAGQKLSRKLVVK